MTSFLKRNNLLTRHISKNATKKKFPLTRYFLTLLTIANFFLCYVTIFSMVCYETHYFHLYLIDSRPFYQKEIKKRVKEIKEELLELIFNPSRCSGVRETIRVTFTKKKKNTQYRTQQRRNITCV